MKDVTACTGGISGQEGPKRTRDLSGIHNMPPAESPSRDGLKHAGRSVFSYRQRALYLRSARVVPDRYRQSKLIQHVQLDNKTANGY